MWNEPQRLTRSNPFPRGPRLRTLRQVGAGGRATAASGGVAVSERSALAERGRLQRRGCCSTGSSWVSRENAQLAYVPAQHSSLVTLAACWARQGGSLTGSVVSPM